MIHQSGVIPYRIRDRQIEVLLVTSSKGKNWGIPKGWVEPLMTAADSAAKEAWEEAGITGAVHQPSIGVYQRRKWGLPFQVEVFLMEVETVLDDWQEAKNRKRQWLTLPQAIKRVKRSELKQLLNQVERQVSAFTSPH
ncbi:MAG TPA: NUDIX hydrolase [Trichocoleus sp.]